MDKPKISQNLDITALSDGRFSIFNKRSKKTFILGAAECAILRFLDGNTDTVEISSQFNMSEEKISRLIEIFDELGFLKSSEVESKQSITRLSIGVFNPNHFLKTGGRTVNILSSILLYVPLPLLMLGIMLSIRAPGIFTETATFFSTARGLLILPFTLTISMLHEIGHVVIAKRYGANVPELGLVLYWFLPAMYVNLSCVNLIQKKYQRILAYAGGLMVNTLLIAVALCIRVIAPSSARPYFSWFVINSLLSILFNLLIFLKYDGYLIFKEMVNQPYLREKSLDYVRAKLPLFSRRTPQSIRNANFVIETKDACEPTASERALFLGYGLFAMLYIPALIAMLGLTLVRLILP